MNCFKVLNSSITTIYLSILGITWGLLTIDVDFRLPKLGHGHCSPELEIKDTSNTYTSDSYLDIFLGFDNLAKIRSGDMNLTSFYEQQLIKYAGACLNDGNLRKGGKMPMNCTIPN